MSLIDDLLSEPQTADSSATLAAYPVATMSDGTTLLSDGTRVGAENEVVYTPDRSGDDFFTSNVDQSDNTVEVEGFDFDSLEAEFGLNLDDYVQGLKDEAQGDYDFITKFIERQHTIALGENDQKRAEFFLAVANSLEKEIGRIPFDFQLKTGREKQDLV